MSAYAVAHALEKLQCAGASVVLEKMTHLTPRHVLGRSGSELEKTSGEFGLNDNILEVDTDCSECMICKLSKTAAKLRPDLRGDEFYQWRLK